MHFMMNTAAWKSLDATARAIYVHMAMRYAGPRSNNGRLPYSVREAAAEFHVGKSTAARAISALIDRGFIVIAKRGAFSRKTRHATEFRLTEFPSDVDNTLATKDFVHWSQRS
jgi:DNA-binding transcriptional regulator YhcF (GntR family)